MNLLIRYIPYLVSTTVFFISVLIKVLFVDFSIQDFLKDVIVFFVIYTVFSFLTMFIQQMFKNYWKID